MFIYYYLSPCLENDAIYANITNKEPCLVNLVSNARPGLEPGTSRTHCEYRTGRPTSLFFSFSEVVFSSQCIYNNQFCFPLYKKI